jgi:A/G-specific adenine glycosylase
MVRIPISKSHTIECVGEVRRRRIRIQQFRRSLVGWFKHHGRYFPWRRKSATKYCQIVSEVLLQRTRAETVGSFYRDFEKVYPSWKELAGATTNDLEVLLRPLGLWKRRASSLLALANELQARNGRFPKCRSEIEKLPGVGQYIANAVLLLVHRKAEPLLDVNMARVLERCFGPRNLVDIRHDPYLQKLAKDVVSGRKPERINWAILDLAALICLERNPLCERCPLVAVCQNARKKRSSALRRKHC